MVVNEYEDSVSEDRGKMALLLAPVPDRCCLMNAICSQVENRTDIKQEEDKKPSEDRENLESLGVFDVTETE